MKNTRKLILTSALALVASFAFAEKPLKIGVEGAYPPFSEVNKDGELIGFDIEIANALCQHIKRTCELVQVDWDGLIPALKARKIDAIIASMSATEERKKNIDFTDRYYRIPAKIIRKKGDNIEFSKESLKNKIIGVQVSTTIDNHITDLFGDIAQIKRYTSNNDAYLDLKAGRLDAFASDSLPLKHGFLDKEAGKDYEFFGPDLVDEKYYGEGIAIGLRKNDDKLKQSLNKAIREIRQNGVYKKINDKYFDFDVYGD